VTKRISVLGCGWLGGPLAISLRQKGYLVKGSTTSMGKLSTLTEAGIEAFLFDVKTDDYPFVFFETDVLVIAFPPKSKQTDGEWYASAVRRVTQMASSSKVRKVILLSSTSVYPDWAETYTEDNELDSNSSAAPSLVKAEQEVRDIFPESAYVLRLGGLAGDDRLLARHFAGKKDLKSGDSPVNLLHREDAVRILTLFAENEFKAGVYNVCAGQHPSRNELYTADCKRFGLPLPHFSEEESKGKTISNQKLLDETGYRFVYPDPKSFDYTV
jgi:nucleoside-diphosphate-sugar epimerase